jgi:glutamate transport system permease protein
MSTNVLFDVPGPKAAARHRIFGALTLLVVAALLGWILWTLYQKGEFEAELWEDLAQPNIWRAIRIGLQGTIAAAAVAIVLSVALGALLAVGRLSDHRSVRIPAVIFVEFFRAVPLLLLIMFVFLGFGGTIGRYWSVVLALTLYNGSVLAEVFRAGINAIPRGQSEAAYAIGMRKNQVMRQVLVPQSVTIMLPAIVSQCVIVLKDTALGVFIAYGDLVRQVQLIAEFVNHAIVPLCLAALIFIIINYSLSRFASWLEARLRRGSHTAAPKVTKEDILEQPLI